MKLNVHVKLFLGFVICMSLLGAKLLSAAESQEGNSSESHEHHKPNNPMATEELKKTEIPEGEDDNKVINFKLKNQHGEKVKFDDFNGKVVIVVFGYTNCPDVCPTQLNDLTQVVHNLKDEAKEVQVLFITFDPERDTPEVIKKFLKPFDPSFIGLTGTVNEVAKVTYYFDVHTIKRSNKEGTDYKMGHTSYVYLIDREGEFKNFYLQKVGTSYWEQMKHHLKELIDHKVATKS